MKNASTEKTYKKRLPALVVSAALMLTAVFIPSAAAQAAAYTPSDTEFSAPDISCTANNGVFGAEISWDAVEGAESYTVTVYEPDGDVAGTVVTDELSASVPDIAQTGTADIYTAQVLASAGENTIKASMITQFVPYDASSFDFRDYNGTETDISGFTRGSGTLSPDGTAIAVTETGYSYIDIVFQNIPIADDAEYLVFWVGTETTETSYQVSDYTVTITNEDGESPAQANAWQPYYISSLTGEVHTHSRGAGETNTWYDDANCFTGKFTQGYIAIPLSRYSNPEVILGRNCTVKISLISLRVYSKTDNTELANTPDRPFYFDSFGTISDIGVFEANIKNLLADYAIEKKSFAHTVEADYENSDDSFKAPVVTCIKDASGIKLNASVTWSAVNNADGYRVTVFKPNGTAFAVKTVDEAAAVIEGIPINAAAELPYSVQIVALKGEEELCASVVEQFIPYDASSFDFRDYNGTETDISGFTRGSGTLSPDGTAIAVTETGYSYIDIVFQNIPIADDAEYLVFWVGTETTETSYQVSDYTVTITNEDGESPAQANAWQPYYISSLTGEVHTHSRGAGETNTWYDDANCFTGKFTQGYIAIPLSRYSNPEVILGRNCTVKISLISLRVYSKTDNTELANTPDRPFYFDSFGTISDIGAFTSVVPKILADYSLGDITYMDDDLPYADSDRRFMAPEAEVKLGKSGLNVSFSWEPFPGADSYELKVYNSLLNEMTSLSADTCSASVSGLSEGYNYTVQVIAKNGGDIVAASAYRKFMAYDNSKYYTIGNDCSGSDINEWEGGGKTDASPDGEGYWWYNGSYVSVDFADVEIPDDAEALVLWVGQEDLGDGTRLIPNYTVRFAVDGNFNNCSPSGVESTIYYVPTDGGRICSNNRGINGEKVINTFYYPANISGGFRGEGFIIIPLSLYDTADVTSVLGTTTSIRVVMDQFSDYDKDGNIVTSGHNYTPDRKMYIDNIGTISDIDAFVNDFDSYFATYIPVDTFYYSESAQPLASADDFTFAVNSAEGSNMVRVPLYFESGKEVASAEFAFNYNTEALELISVVDSEGAVLELSGDTFKASGLKAGLSCFATATFTVTSTELATHSSIGFTCTDEAIATRSIEVTKSAERGDVNNDGNVNILDLIRLKKYEAADRDNTGFDEIDVNADNMWDANDLISLRKHLLGV